MDNHLDFAQYLVISGQAFLALFTLKIFLFSLAYHMLYGGNTEDHPAVRVERGHSQLMSIRRWRDERAAWGGPPRPAVVAASSPFTPHSRQPLVCVRDDFQ